MKYRQFLFMPILFMAIVLLSVIHVQRLAAQSNGTQSANESIPAAQVYLPLVANNFAPTPPLTFESIPISGAPIDRPAHLHGDLNLSLRSYVTTTGELELINVGGDTDPDAPQLAAMFAPARLPSFTAVYRVNNWNWNCESAGCRDQPIENPKVTLLEMATTAGEAIAVPSRNQQIYGGGYKAMVLYAEATRITIVYTRDDTPAFGYVVHIEDFTVEPALLALYQQLNQAGRAQLPAVRNGETIGYASGTTIKVVVRDTGSFMDPRSRKDWWVGY